MTPIAAPTGIVHLTERTPQISGAEMVASLVPPPQFEDATFDSYRAIRPSRRSRTPRTRSWRSPVCPRPLPAADSSAARRSFPTSSRASTSTAASASARPTCSPRSITRCPCAGSTSARSSSTPRSSVRSATRRPSSSSAARTCSCIDEFELDDPGDTMVMTRLLGELVSTGHASGGDIQHAAQRPRRGPLRRAGLPPRDPRDGRELRDDPHRRHRLPPPRPRRSRGRPHGRRLRRRRSRMPPRAASSRTTRSRLSSRTWPPCTRRATSA